MKIEITVNNNNCFLNLLKFMKNPAKLSFPLTNRIESVQTILSVLLNLLGSYFKYDG